MYVNFYLFFLIFYLFIHERHREKETGRDIGRGRSRLHAGSPMESPSASVDTCTFLSSFVCSSRTLLIDGRVELKRGLQRQERHLFLFNDLFVVAKIKYNNNFKIKNKIKLCDMWTASCVDEVGEGNTNATKSFVLGWPTVNFVATFRT
ncbi:unnamed protein product [Nyctereutes procyonoides]|uniref:(raccoon dog) hypothetical protein n=1 Tax=Nyctereutes procyonoides TaxID=34880 RepID=A0A811ZMN4_NYCPR|nr:unnamed protein product [Nyctereutes procyonoides]